MESAIALEKLLDFMPRYEVDFDRCKRVHMQNVAGWQHVPVKVSADDPEVEVDFGLCESNGVCMGIIPEVFDLDDEDYLHVLQDEVTPENEAADPRSGPPVPSAGDLDPRRVTPAHTAVEADKEIH